jgi:DNA repair photolyase
MANAHRGRAAGVNPPNRFERLHLEPIDVELSPEDRLPLLRTVFFRDSSRSILARNDSPDLPFTYSLNPYRGCEHGCIYCYARPSHEYLGFSSGLDFESRIMVKLDAPQLLEETLRKERWTPQVVALSGNTDCYQPVERQLRLTRMCLEVFLKYRNPVTIVTKNALILRDREILASMARHGLVQVMVSVTSLRPPVVRAMEPRTSTPESRLEAIERLASAGIPVGVNASPIIPGLTDEEIPAILSAAAARGATSAGYILVRLPGPVRPLFTDWVRREFPERSAKILGRIRETRDGAMSDARFGTRMTGEGSMAEAIRDLFEVSAARCNLNRRPSLLCTERFAAPARSQMELFSPSSL